MAQSLSLETNDNRGPFFTICGNEGCKSEDIENELDTLAMTITMNNATIGAVNNVAVSVPNPK
jgi:hypothetical protein